MTATPDTRHSVVTTSEPIKNKWSLAIAYFCGQEIRETFAVGATKQQTLDRWFLQFYSGSVPSGACIPDSAFFISWVKFVPAK
jgi:hypothetical protein